MPARLVNWSSTGYAVESGSEAHIVMKAAEDDDFRARPIADRREAVEEATNLRFPEDYRLGVHEESSTAAHLLLLASPALSRGATEPDCQRVYSGMEHSHSLVTKAARFAIRGQLGGPRGSRAAAGFRRRPSHDAPATPVHDSAKLETWREAHQPRRGFAR